VFIPNPDTTARSISVGGFDTNPFDPGFVGPADLASCAISAGSAVAGDFVVTVVDASAPDGTTYVLTGVDVSVELRDQ